jgi:hypothetical protein
MQRGKKSRGGLPATLERTYIVRIANVDWQKSFARIETIKKAIAARGWGPINCILLHHPELQKTKDRVKLINDIYKKQVKDGINITDLFLWNKAMGSMGLAMDTFLDHTVQEKAIGQLYAAEKKQKRCISGQWKKDGGARLSAGLMVIPDECVIYPECLGWAPCGLDWKMKGRKETRQCKARQGRLERIKLKEKADMVLSKCATPDKGKCNNTDLKVIIRWYKVNSDKVI